MNKIYQKECESTCEYSLPDYMGDVKKILTVSGAVIPSGKFVSDGEAEFSGVVTYDVLYSDSEGKLTRLTASSDYDVAVPIDSEGYVDAFAQSRVVNLAVRLTGPRKLTAKAVVSTNVKVSCEEDLSCSGNAFSEGYTPQTAKRNITVERSLFASSPEREYAEEAEKLNGISADEIEIIATSGSVRITESEATDAGVLVRGELIITSIIRTENQPPFAIKKIIPFEETVNLDGLNPDMQVMADGYLTSVTSGVAEDADGSVITVNAIAELTCMASVNQEVSVITDAYLENRDTSGEYESYGYTELICMANSEESFSASVSRSDIGCDEIRDILTLSCEVRSFDKKIGSNGFELNGEALFSGIACEINEDNEAVYLPVKFTVPFAVNVNCGCQLPDTAALECTVSAIDTEATLDSEKLSVKSSLKIGYRVSNSAAIRRITECNTVGDTEYFNTSSTVTVYYPDNDETLFEIAKKYHTTGAKIAADNNLSEPTLAISDLPASLAGVKKLIIR